MCSNCNAENSTNSTVPFSLDYNGRLIVVRDVPCKRCLYCDDVVFDDDVAARLESIVDNFKHSSQDISIVHFSSLAA